MKNALLFISFLLVFSGCTMPVFMTRTAPPEVVPEKQPARIVFSNRFDYRENPGIKDKHEDAYRTAIEELGKSLENETSGENAVVNFIIDSLGSRHKTVEIFNVDMPESEVLSLCRLYEADYLLSIDSLHLYFDWEVIREDDPFDGSVSKTKDFYLFNNFFVTLYDTAGKVVERSLLERSLHYSSRPTLGALITIVPNLDNAKEKIGILARETGIGYIGKFFPSEETFGHWELYTGKVFKETNSLIIGGQYDQAISLLHEMSINSKPKQIKKINHNLSVAAEMKKLSSRK